MKGRGERASEDGRAVDAADAPQPRVAGKGMWEAFVAAAQQFSPDFMEEREQPGWQERDESRDRSRLCQENPENAPKGNPAGP